MGQKIAITVLRGQSEWCIAAQAREYEFGLQAKCDNQACIMLSRQQQNPLVAR
ncbi:MAG: hypothetical protein Q4P24_14775 [Rhodobacterales bacterium]|nr:hypothetical protein [Rhodobacterales bacterium]